MNLHSATDRNKMDTISNYSSYKEFHEQSMQHLNGTTKAEVLLVVLPGPLGVLLANISLALIKSNITQAVISSYQENLIDFVNEFLALILPLILGFTVLNHNLQSVIGMLGVTLLALLSYIIYVSSEKTFSKHSKQWNFKALLLFQIAEGRSAAVSNFRAMVNLMTAICILAVDFKIFPRRFAKTETYGCGVMDTGVALFIVANAIVAPEARGMAVSAPILKSIKSSIPLFVLGGIRFFVTQQADYQQHVSEYGVHWNFFITLAITKVLCAVILQYSWSCNSLLLSLLLIGIHQLILFGGIGDWVLSNQIRDSFITANREGIISLLGYVALYFAAIHIGKIIWNDRSNFQNVIGLGSKLLILSVIFWGLTNATEHSVGVSRRLANLGYFAWMVAYSSTMLLLFLVVEVVIGVINKCEISEKSRQAVVSNIESVPLILKAINYNGLSFFLLANMLTGVINVCFQTLLLDTMESLLIICTYVLVICAITVFLHQKHIKLKVW